MRKILIDKINVKEILFDFDKYFYLNALLELYKGFHCEIEDSSEVEFNFQIKDRNLNAVYFSAYKGDPSLPYGNLGTMPFCCFVRDIVFMGKLFDIDSIEDEGILNLLEDFQDRFLEYVDKLNVRDYLPIHRIEFSGDDSEISDLTLAQLTRPSDYINELEISFEEQHLPMIKRKFGGCDLSILEDKIFISVSK